MRGTDVLPRTGLARSLSKLGFCSRSQARALIVSGKVRLNGQTRTDPETPVHLGRDRIQVEGKKVDPAGKTYLLMNKPRGVITTRSDEKGRRTVYDLLAEHAASAGLPKVAAVGRLDKASEGLLLFTNDSEWSNRVLAPGTHLEKIYHVQIAALADQTLIQDLERGAELTRERVLRVKSARVVRRGLRNTWLEVVLEEGKNRQIRRILQKFGIEVLRLVRVAVGPLALGVLAKGEIRLLTKAEKAGLDRAMQARL